MTTSALTSFRSAAAFAAISALYSSSITPGFAATAAAVPPAPKVTVAPVEERLITEYEELSGRVDAAETVELRARVSGHLESVGFHAGQVVAAGDVLFTIDSRWYRAQFD